MRKFKRMLLTGAITLGGLAPVTAPIMMPANVIAAETGYTISNNKLLENGKAVTKTGNFTVNGKKYYVREGVVYGEVVNVETGWYEIHSNVKGKTDFNLDVAGGEFKEGANIQMFKDNNTIAQRFHFRSVGDGIYHIACGTGNHTRYLDVADGKKGENVRQWTDNAGNAEKFRVVKNSDGSVSLINENTGQAIDISGDDKFDNGRNVWDYPFMFGADKGQTFKLQKVCNTGELPWNTSGITSGWYQLEYANDKNYVLDTKGNVGINGTNIQMYKKNGTNAQKFYIKNLGYGKYQIRTGTTNGSSAIDAGGTKYATGSNVHEWEQSTTNNNQIWEAFKYKDGNYAFVNIATGQALDIAGSGLEDGKNVQVYTHFLPNNGLTWGGGQGWTLTPCKAPTGAVYNHKGEVKAYLNSSGEKIKNVVKDGVYFDANGNARDWVTPDDTGIRQKTVDGKSVRLNDREAIQRALNLGIKKIKIAGTYTLDGTCIGVSQDNVQIYGGGTLKLPNDANTGKRAIQIHAKNFSISNINFVGNYTSLVRNVESYNSSCICFTTNDKDKNGINNFNAKVTNCTFKNTGRRGILVHSYKCDKNGLAQENRDAIPRVSNVTISGCNFQNNNGIALCTAGGHNLWIRNNTFNNSGLEHITLDWATMDSEVTGNKFYGITGGCGVIGVDTAKRCKIYGNTFNTTYKPHVRLNDNTGKSESIGIQRGITVTKGTQKFNGNYYWL